MPMRLSSTLRQLELPLARLAIFVVYFWFGLLKLIGVSPAGEMVHALFDVTIHIFPFATFYTLFALFEMLIGLLFLVKGMEKIALCLIAVHLVLTVLPLIILPAMTWQGLFQPTLEGQYIIKNILILSAAVTVGARRFY